MPAISEAVGNQSQLNAALNAGLTALDRNQTVVFTQYTKTVLPADGYVFWVATQNTITVAGSVHYGINKQQNEDETIAINHVIFTAEAQVQAFDAVGPTTMYLGTFEGLQFAFSNQGNFYRQADIWHYRGDAVYPALSSQIVSSAADLDALEPIVSNSLPIWLALTQFAPVYPSFLVPDNIAPPYVVAHIGETDTDALQPLPIYDYGLTFNSGVPGLLQIGIGAIGQTTQTFGNPTDIPAPGFGNPVVWQLMRDKVRLTLYGFTNTQALSYRDYLLQYSLNTDAFGLCGDGPFIRDAKRSQRELGIIAQKKTLDMTVSYYQTAVSTIAENLILSVSETFIIGAV